jgi:hypothetical protein
MIMPCMNSTSFLDVGGSFARVDAGSTFVGCPGAPGCTMTGVEPPDWAEVDSEKSTASETTPNILDREHRILYEIDWYKCIDNV